jgi:DNA mismatch repair protein MutS
VAALAGVPGSVIRAAKKRLAELEQAGAARDSQGDLFNPAPPAGEPLPEPPSPALEVLRGINPDELAPRDALDLLYRLKKLAQ